MGPTAEDGAEEHLEFAPRGFFDIGRRNLGGKNRSINLFTRVGLRPDDSVDDPGGSPFGFADYRVIERRPQDQLVIGLRYGPDKRHSIREIQRVSKPGLRVYAGKEDIPLVRSRLGIAIVSTTQGVLAGYEARRRGIGGEVLCTVF